MILVLKNQFSERTEDCGRELRIVGENGGLWERWEECGRETIVGGKELEYNREFGERMGNFVKEGVIL